LEGNDNAANFGDCIQPQFAVGYPYREFLADESRNNMTMYEDYVVEERQIPNGTTIICDSNSNNVEHGARRSTISRSVGSSEHVNSNCEERNSTIFTASMAHTCPEYDRLDAELYRLGLPGILCGIGIFILLVIVLYLIYDLTWNTATTTAVIKSYIGWGDAIIL
jgi:hypothetical protein